MKKAKRFIIPASFILLMGCQDIPQDVDSKIMLTCSNHETLTDQTIEIQIESNIEDFYPDLSSFAINDKNGNLALKDKNTVLFNSPKEGTYKISYKDDHITSNMLSIEVNEEKESVTKPDISAPLEVNTENNLPHNAPMSVDTLVENAGMYLDTDVEVWVQGDLPQSLLPDNQGKLKPVLFNDDHSDYMVLNGNISLGDCHVYITGTLTYNGYNYVLNVHTIEQSH